MLGIVLINYNTEDKTIGYVHHELSKIQYEHVLVIVNNSCTEESNIKLAEGCKAEIVTDADKIDKASDTFVVDARENLGYAKGNNLGACFLLKHFDIDYILFTNNDLRIVDENVVEKLIDKANQHESIGAVGPKITYTNNRDNSPCKKSSICSFILRNYFAIFSILIKDMFTDVIQNAQEGYYDYLAGCFFLVKAKAFMKCEGFDSNTFLYTEEKIFGERLSKNDYKCYYVDSVKVIHEHQFTIKRFLKSMANLKLLLESQLYYYQQYRNASPIWLFLSKMSIKFNLLQHSLLAPLKRIIEI